MEARITARRDERTNTLDALWVDYQCLVQSEENLLAQFLRDIEVITNDLAKEEATIQHNYRFEMAEHDSA